MIISTSIGGGRKSDICDDFSTAMTDAAANAVAAGITIFASSGNSGYCDSMTWPACISDVISVGAVYNSAFGIYSTCVSSLSCADKHETYNCSGWLTVDYSRTDKVASYSNTAIFLDMLAPAEMTLTTAIGSGYIDDFGGTSAACAFAAGATACLQSAERINTGSFLTPSQVRNALLDFGDPVKDEKTGIIKPRLNLNAAVTNATSYSVHSLARPESKESDDGSACFISTVMF